jgi:magnesium transporter
MVIKDSIKKKGKISFAVDYITNNVPIVPDYYSIEDIQKFINKNIKNFETIDYIYIINNKKDLIGLMSIKKVFEFYKKTKIKDIIERNFISVPPNITEQKITNLVLKHNLKTIPIVEEKKLIGIILTNKILSILHHTLHKRLLYSAGIHKDHLEYEDTMEVPLLLTLWHRIPWLVIGLIGVLFAAGFISKYENILDKHLILVFFIPAIVYMSDALGTQLQTLLIRDLAIFGKEFKIVPYFLRQMLIGIILGAVIGFIIYITTNLFWKEPKIALIISLAMFITLVLSSFTSLITTYLFKVFGADPALGSGPFATIISDVSSIIIYFIVVSLML